MRKYFIEEREIDKQCSNDKSVKAGVAERMVCFIKVIFYFTFRFVLSNKNFIKYSPIKTRKTG
jgi:hypothetical protein